MENRDYETLRRDLSHNLRRIRRDAGLSQEQLSLQAGLTRSSVSQIERAVGNPSLMVLAALASTLKRDVMELLAPSAYKL